MVGQLLWGQRLALAAAQVLGVQGGGDSGDTELPLGLARPCSASATSEPYPGISLPRDSGEGAGLALGTQHRAAGLGRLAVSDDTGQPWR